MTPQSEQTPEVSARAQKTLLKNRTFDALGLYVENGKVFGIAQTCYQSPLNFVKFFLVEEQERLLAPLIAFPRVRKVIRDEYTMGDMTAETLFNNLKPSTVALKKLREGNWYGEVDFKKDFPLDEKSYSDYKVRIPPIQFNPVKLLAAYQTARERERTGADSEGLGQIEILLNAFEKVHGWILHSLPPQGIEEKFVEGMQSFAEKFNITRAWTAKELKRMKANNDAQVIVYTDDAGAIAAGALLVGEPEYAKKLERAGFVSDFFVDPRKIDPVLGLRVLFNNPYWLLKTVGKLAKTFYTHSLSKEHEAFLQKELGFGPTRISNLKYTVLEHRF